jgi:hypothetical protein
MSRLFLSRNNEDGNAWTGTLCRYALSILVRRRLPNRPQLSRSHPPPPLLRSALPSLGVLETHPVTPEHISAEHACLSPKRPHPTDRHAPPCGLLSARAQLRPRPYLAVRDGVCGGESFPRVYWVAVPKASRARRVNRPCARHSCWGGARATRAAASTPGWSGAQEARALTSPSQPAAHRADCGFPDVS